jgi:multiple antibiotic resistance protein
MKQVNNPDGARLFIETFVTLFVITDPPGTVPVFLALTRRMPPKKRAKAAWQAALVSLGVIVAFAVFGQSILTYMHVSFPALQASGGLLLLLIALQLLTGKTDEPDAAESVNVALVPLGTPLLAGPGAIVATMVAVRGAGGQPSNWVAVTGSIVLVHVCLWLAMRFAGGIRRVLGAAGTELVARVAGLLLAAIAVQLMADAVTAFIQAAR